MAIPMFAWIPKYDFFISHAGADKGRYIEPLAQAMARKALSLWLDDLEIAWGDNISMRLSEGLRDSRFVILCLSRNFLKRPWPETELGAALALQNSSGKKRVLPLILNSKTQVLARYPILAGLSHREFKSGVEHLAQELAALIEPREPGDKQKLRSTRLLRVTVESIHTGQVCHVSAVSMNSVRWLADRAREGLGVTTQADTGAYEPFSVRWVLVDAKAEEIWRSLSRSEQRRLHAMIISENGLRLCYSDLARLDEIGLYDGIVFHLYAVEDEEEEPPAAKYGF